MACVSMGAKIEDCAQRPSILPRNSAAHDSQLPVQSISRPQQPWYTKKQDSQIETDWDDFSECLQGGELDTGFQPPPW